MESNETQPEANKIFEQTFSLLAKGLLNEVRGSKEQKEGLNDKEGIFSQIIRQIALDDKTRPMAFAVVAQSLVDYIESVHPQLVAQVQEVFPERNINDVNIEKLVEYHRGLIKKLFSLLYKSDDSFSLSDSDVYKFRIRMTDLVGNLIISASEEEQEKILNFFRNRDFDFRSESVNDLVDKIRQSLQFFRQTITPDSIFNFNERIQASLDKILP